MLYYEMIVARRAARAVIWNAAESLFFVVFSSLSLSTRVFLCVTFNDRPCVYFFQPTFTFKLGLVVDARFFSYFVFYKKKNTRVYY